jgi:hypothetical protein
MRRRTFTSHGPSTLAAAMHEALQTDAGACASMTSSQAACVSLSRGIPGLRESIRCASYVAMADGPSTTLTVCAAPSSASAIVAP